MALDKKNLLIRCASGVIYIGAIVGAILVGKIGMAFLTSLLSLGAVYELESNTLGKDSGTPWKSIWMLDSAVILCFIWAISNVAGNSTTIVLGSLGFLLLAFRFIFQIFSKGNAVSSIAISTLSYLYIGFPLALFALIGAEPINRWVIICAVAMIWINDTGAYLVGCTIGRNKMFPGISPKKSWEGFTGGLLFNIAAAFIFFYCFRLDQYLIISNVMGWIFIGICVTAFATLGDLFESILKRSLGIKDFGNIIPGHGGVLDRIDSLLFVVPGVCLMLLLTSIMF